MAKEPTDKPTTPIRRGTPLAEVVGAPAGLTLHQQAKWARAQRERKLAERSSATPPADPSSDK
jgi:hypothetical protein